MKAPGSDQLVRDAAEFWQALRAGDVRALFQSGTGNSVVQLFRYALVGGSTFLADFILLFVLTRLGVPTVPAAGTSFAVGITCNFLLTKFFAFKSVDPRVGGAGEVAIFAFISAVGLVLTMAFMHLFTDVLGLYVMVSKLVSAVLVFTWNFLGRKLILYPGKRRNSRGEAAGSE